MLRRKSEVMPVREVTLAALEFPQGSRVLPLVLALVRAEAVNGVGRVRAHVARVELLLGVLVVDVVPQPPPVGVVVPAVFASRGIRRPTDSVLQSDMPVVRVE